MYRYVFKATDEHMLQGLSRFLRANTPWPRALGAIRWLATIIFAAGAVYAFARGNHSTGVAFVLLATIMVAANTIINWTFLRRFKRSPFRGSDVVVDLLDEGMNAHDRLCDVRLDWRVVSKAARFADGFLITLGEQQFYWLPHVRLASGDPDAVETLLRAHVKNYRTLT